MNEFLSDYLLAISSRSRKKVKDVLQSAKISKEQTDEIASRLVNLKERAPILVRPEPYAGLIDNSNIDSIYRDTRLKFRELYSESNTISLLLDSNMDVLSSEIKKQADQIDSFNKFVDNYNFMLADRGFYDAAYTETFSDDIQQEKSIIINTMLEDRSGVDFKRSVESLEVDKGAGVLSMSAGFDEAFRLKASVLKSNSYSYITSDTGIENSATATPGNGWRVAVSSPRPIISSIYENTEKGCQFEIEYSIEGSSAARADTFALTPLADLPTKILSLKVYGEENSQHVELINDPVYLDRNKNFYFPQQIVSRIVVVLSQPIYNRGKLPPSVPEQEYKKVLTQQRKEKKLRPKTERSQRASQRLFARWFLKSEKARAELVKPVSNLSKYSDRISIEDAISYEKESANIYSNFKFRGSEENIFEKWISDKLFGSQSELLGRFSKKERTSTNSSEIPFVLNPTQGQVEANNVASQNYEYSLGIRNAKLGSTSNKYRGLFISKPVPAPVQSGEVRVRVDELNYDFLNSFLDDEQVTTIEYSVTNKPNPNSENDWVPILPANAIFREITERIFPQSSGFAGLRFPASNEIGVSVYKNGTVLSLEDASIVRSDDSLYFVGVRIPADQLSLNPDDVYTAKYIPNGDPYTVNFRDKGFPRNSIATAFDDNGAGELYEGLSGSKAITLRNFPYVDYKQLKSSSGYSSLGLTGSYQPITIILEDGSTAFNYTNYFGLEQLKLDADSSSYSFLHSGQQILFNKDIDQSFRVYYQYEPSYLRYRIIFRVNSKVKVSPAVNSLTLKMKMNSSILGNNEKKV